LYNKNNEICKYTTKEKNMFKRPFLLYTILFFNSLVNAGEPETSIPSSGVEITPERKQLDEKLLESKKLSDQLQANEKSQSELLTEYNSQKNQGTADELSTLETEQKKLSSQEQAVNSTIVELNSQLKNKDVTITSKGEKGALQAWQDKYDATVSLFADKTQLLKAENQLKQTIKTLPIETFKTPQEGIKQLSEIYKKIESLKTTVKTELLTVEPALKQKIGEFIQHEQFKGTFKAVGSVPEKGNQELSTVAGLIETFNGLSKQDLPDGFKKIVQDDIITRLTREIRLADSSTFSTLFQLINKVASEPEQQTILQNALARKRIDVFRRDAITQKKGITADDAKKLLEETPDQYKKFAEMAIVDEFLKDVKNKIKSKKQIQSISNGYH